MYIDRRYRSRRRRSPFMLIAVLLMVGGAAYLLATRTKFFVNPFDPLPPTPTPTRSAPSYLAEAEELYAAGRLAGAAAAYARVAELEPANDEALRQQAWLLIHLGHPERAIEVVTKAVALNPSAANLGILAMAQDWHGDFDAAIKTAIQAVDKDPLSAEAHAILAEVYADRNNWIRALAEAQTAVKLDPDSPIAQRNLGYVLSLQGRHAEALAAFEQAARLAPHLGYIYSSAGHTYLARGDYENALAQFQKAIEANPDSPVGYDLYAHASALSGDPDRALSMLRKAIELDPTYGLAHARMAHVYYTLLNWEAAIENFERAMALGVENEQYFYEFGLSYAYLGDCANAMPWLEKALVLNPNSKPALDGLRLCSKG